LAKGDYEMATIFLRDFPEDLRRNAKAQAALMDISLKELIIRALTEYLMKEGDITHGKEKQ
jgi:hypothetical protein